MSNKPERFFSIDVIRGVAVLGMIFINILVFVPDINEIIWHDYLTGDKSSNELLYKIIYILFNGKMRALFALLFGVGIVLFFQTNSPLNKIDLFLRRMLLLMLFGLFHAYFLLWPGSILFEYACCGLLLVTFRNLSPKKLLLLSFTFLGLYAFFNVSDFNNSIDQYNAYIQLHEAKIDQTPSEDLILNKEKFENYLEQYPPFSESRKKEIISKREEKINQYTSSLISIFQRNKSIVNEALSFGVYLNILESIGTMFLGMFLFRIGFFNHQFKRYIYLTSTLTLIPLGFIMYHLQYQWQGHTQAQILLNYSNSNFSSFGMEQLARLVLCGGYCSLFIFLASLKPMKPVLTLIANVGRMAFTNYILQTTICVLIFYCCGYYGSLHFHEIVYLSIAIVILQIIASKLIINHFKTGPIEYIWRTLALKMTVRKIES